MGRTVRTLAIAAAAVATALPAMAGPVLSVELNHVRRVLLHGVAANVIIAEPKIADVTLVDGHSIVIMGRGYGDTGVIVTDHAGRVLFDGDVVVPVASVVSLLSGSDATDFSCSPRCTAVDTQSGLPKPTTPETIKMDSHITVSHTP